MRLVTRTVAAALLCAALLSAALAAAESAPSYSLPYALQSLGVGDAAPFACSYSAPDGKYFDFSSMTTPTGTQVPGVANNEVYMINVCGSTSQTDRQRAKQEHRTAAGWRCGWPDRRSALAVDSGCSVPDQGGDCIASNATVCMWFR